MIDGDAPQTPEQALVTAILMQAYRDLFLTVRNESNASFTTRADQDQAISFLTDRAGSLAQHRNALCALIGWDGDLFAARVRAMMEGAPFPHPSPDPKPAARKRHAEAVELLRERWQHLKSPRKRSPFPVGDLMAAE
ncbi:hypothetical protein CDO87_21085 [Sagittula sp. P11]|uniref:hypothetical protein n=1 Tax=Sagittula sp. P11 TaxID=2009329 RepID=UPI000C2D385F|nr:hypothetical protein [Sagittula sp. P11]AUC55501.1 hypothetical protein CDO87_21085 [Sagittula sp. P11]